MDDPMLDAERDPNKNKFGFNKRNLPSIDARLKQALADGKYAKAKRLQKKNMVRYKIIFLVLLITSFQ